VEVACRGCCPEEMLEVETGGCDGTAAEWVSLLR
jgi:hypothetical protein